MADTSTPRKSCAHDWSTWQVAMLREGKARSLPTRRRACVKCDAVESSRDFPERRSFSD